jgi:hypothetical protein
MTTSNHQSNASTMATQIVNPQELLTLGEYRVIEKEITQGMIPIESLQIGRSPRLFDFDHRTSYEEVVAVMDRDGYRPGSLGDLIAHGSRTPDSKDIVVALAKIKVGECEVFGQILWQSNEGRRLLLEEARYADGLIKRSRFLGVLK